MKILLKIFAVMVGLAVLRTILMIFQFAASRSLAELVDTGIFGFITIAGWCLILVAGPVASVQLWRLRRIGLYVSATLCAFALLYYLYGYAAGGTQVRIALLIVPILGNLIALVLLLSPYARRVCS